MEKQLQTNTEITKLKEIIESFKHIGTVEKNSQEKDCVWYSENFPEYRIIYHRKIHDSTYELQEDKSWALFETNSNMASALYDVARVLLADCKNHDTAKYRCYKIENGEAVLLPPMDAKDVQYTVSKDDIEYYKNHPADIAKERFCYHSLKQDYEYRHLLSTILPAVMESLKDYERQEWFEKTQHIYPCEGKECAYSWCCIRHEVKTIRKYDKNKYCL